jgi:hypothetical protein
MVAEEIGFDKAQIGLSPSGAEYLDQVMATDWFNDRQDAYRVAIAVALANGLVADDSELTNAKTAYNFSGGIDRDGKLRTLISILAPTESLKPATYAERLAHAGLKYFAAKVVEGTATLSDILSPSQSSDALTLDTNPESAADAGTSQD